MLLFCICCHILSQSSVCFPLHSRSTAAPGSPNRTLPGEKRLCCPEGITRSADFVDDEVACCWRLSQSCGAAKSSLTAHKKMPIITWQRLTVPHLPLINSEATRHGVGSQRGAAFLKMTFLGSIIWPNVIAETNSL